MEKPQIYLQHLDATNLILWREGAQLSIGIYDDPVIYKDTRGVSIGLSVNLDDKNEHEGELISEEDPRWQNIEAFLVRVSELMEERGLFGPEHSRSLSQILSTEQPIQGNDWQEISQDILRSMPDQWLIRVSNSQQPKNKYQEAIQKLAKEAWHGRKTWDPATIMSEMRMHIEKLHLIHTRCGGVSISDDLARHAEADTLHLWVTDVINVVFYKIGDPFLHVMPPSGNVLVYAGEEGAGDD